jgi:hypothetical protein
MRSRGAWQLPGRVAPLQVGTARHTQARTLKSLAIPSSNRPLSGRAVQRVDPRKPPHWSTVLRRCTVRLEFRPTSPPETARHPVNPLRHTLAISRALDLGRRAAAEKARYLSARQLSLSPNIPDSPQRLIYSADSTSNSPGVTWSPELHERSFGSKTRVINDRLRVREDCSNELSFNTKYCRCGEVELG